MEPDRRPTGLKKLHSLSGVVPVGAFLLLHIWQASSMAGSPAVYDRQIAFLHGGPLLGFLEVVLVLVPLGYHGVYGILRSLQPRDRDHAYDSDLLVVLQRVSGAVVLVFIVAHVWEFRVQTWTGGLAPGSYSTKLMEHLSSQYGGVPWIALGYLVGIAASFFHLVNGMTSFCTTWGFTTSETSQGQARMVFRTGGLLFFCISAALVVQVATGARFFPAEEPKPSLATTCGPSAPPPPAPAPPAPSSSAKSTP